MTKITPNKDLVRRSVRAIEKAIAVDIPQYMHDNHLETNNAIAWLRGDYINENLRRLVVSDDVELISFKRSSWKGRILVDKQEKITYTITTQANLHAIPKKRDRKKPHFLQSILAAENSRYEGHGEQRTLFPKEPFDGDCLQKDYEDLTAGKLDLPGCYKHYIISYRSEQNELQDVKLEFFDKNFTIIDSVTLNEYIKPDFARLTDAAPSEENAPNTSVKEERGLVELRPGIRPQLRAIEEEV